MNPEQLKLYNKYKHDKYPDREYIYIGVDNNEDCWFLCKNENYNTRIKNLNNYGLNMEQVIKDLNLKIYISNNDEKYIEGYFRYWFLEKELIYLKPILKDKLKNIINR